MLNEIVFPLRDYDPAPFYFLYIYKYITASRTVLGKLNTWVNIHQPLIKHYFFSNILKVNHLIGDLFYFLLSPSSILGICKCINSHSIYASNVDREAWCAAIHGVAKSRTRLRDWSDLIWMPEERGLDQSYGQRKGSWWRQSEKYKSSNINYLSRWKPERQW